MAKSSVLTITETEPTPLLKDFATFTRYLVDHRVLLTQTKEFISSKDLYELNSLMTDPTPDTTPRTNQTLYPLLHLFYHLVLAGRLFQKVKVSGKGSRLLLGSTERLGVYQELSPTERYFFLLETLWVDFDWKKLELGYFGNLFLYGIPVALEYLSKQQPGKEVKVEEEGEARELVFIFRGLEYFFLDLSFFGFWGLTRNEEVFARYGHKHSFPIHTLTPSLLGVTLATVLKEARPFFYWNLSNRRRAGEWNILPGSSLSDGSLYESFDEELKPKGSKDATETYKGKPGEKFFIPFLPLFEKGELEQTLPRKKIEFVDATYIFKVSLAKSLWRRIEVAGEHTLLDLHYAIQEAYDFDDDHLYSFFMDGERWSDESFSSLDDEEGPFVDEVCIGELGLSVGQRILYLFDYGDEWRFGVELEEVRTEGSRPSHPKIVEEKGKNPEQYQYYEE